MTTNAHHWILISLVCLIGLVACKMDRSASQSDLLTGMKGPELLFYRENSAQIQLQERLNDLVREACRGGYLTVVRYLFGLQADMNGSDRDGNNPLLLAAQKGNVALLRFLLEQAGADIRSKNHQQITALMITAQAGLEEASRYLIDRGANVNARSAHGASVLMYAASSGKPALVKLCLDRGASPQLVDESGLNALDYALDPETSQILIGLGLSPGQK